MNSWQITPYTVSLLMAALLILAPLVTIARRQGRALPGRRAFMLTLAAICVWCVTYALELSCTNLSDMLILSRLKYCGIAIIPASWLIFCLRYTDRGTFLTTRRLILIEAFIPLALLLVWTNDLHHLFYTVVTLDASGPFLVKHVLHGPIYWLLSFWAYLLLLVAAGLLGEAWLRNSGLYRAQARTMLIAALIPWCANLLYLTSLSPLPGLDLTPLAFLLSGIIVSRALLRYQLFDLMPVAHTTIFTQLDDAILVLDEKDRLQDANPAARALFTLPAGDLTGSFVDALACPGLQAHLASPGDVHEEFTVTGEKESRSYDLRITDITTPQGRGRGHIVMFHDITTHKLTEQALQQSEEKFRRLSRTDGLTGLFNVRTFNEDLALEMERAKRYQLPLTLMFFDIDDFKDFNDSWGHPAGDQVLAAMGELLRSSLRVNDTAYRYGGEEFTVILPCTPGDNAYVVAERLRMAAAALPFTNAKGQTRHVSISIGIARLHKEDDPHTLLSRADELMYRAKSSGKNRVCDEDDTPRRHQGC